MRVLRVASEGAEGYRCGCLGLQARVVRVYECVLTLLGM